MSSDLKWDRRKPVRKNRAMILFDLQPAFRDLEPDYNQLRGLSILEFTRENLYRGLEIKGL